MEAELGIIEAIAKNELLASWDRPRSIEQLRGFVTRREAELVDFEE